jgi:hypothetical protein
VIWERRRNQECALVCRTHPVSPSKTWCLFTSPKLFLLHPLLRLCPLLSPQSLHSLSSCRRAFSLLSRPCLLTGICSDTATSQKLARWSVLQLYNLRCGHFSPSRALCPSDCLPSGLLIAIRMWTP